MSRPRHLHVHAWARPLHGVVTRELLLAAGRDRRDIDLAIKHGDLAPAFPGVYVVRGVPISWLTRVLATLRYLDRQARRRWDGDEPRPLVAVTGIWAAVLHRIPHLDDPGVPIFVVRPRSQSRVARTLQRPELLTSDLAVIDGLTVTSLVWTVAELSAVLKLSHLQNIVADLLRDERLDLVELWSIAARSEALAGPLRALRATLTPEVLAARSKRERETFGWLRRLDVPMPLVNHVLHTVHGSFEVDLCWPDLHLIVEIDGPHHDEADQSAYDDWRDQNLRALGWQVLRFRVDDLDANPDAVMSQIVAAITAAS